MCAYAFEPHSDLSPGIHPGLLRDNKLIQLEVPNKIGVEVEACTDDALLDAGVDAAAACAHKQSVREDQ